MEFLLLPFFKRKKTAKTAQWSAKPRGFGAQRAAGCEGTLAGREQAGCSGGLEARPVWLKCALHRRPVMLPPRPAHGPPAALA